MLQSKYSIQNKTGKQCRERWNNHLDPAISKEPWSEKEEEIMVDFQKKYGNCWSEMAKVLPGRTENAIKNRFYSKLRKCLRSYNKNRPKGTKITASIKTILKDPYTVETLLNHGPEQVICFATDFGESDAETTTGNNSPKSSTCGAESPKIDIQEEKSEESEEKWKIIVPSSTQIGHSGSFHTYQKPNNLSTSMPNVPNMQYISYPQQNYYNYQRMLWASYVNLQSINQLYNTTGQFNFNPLR
mmetsp:Transcript_32536/g.32263  ORF Transcript_32536/g.32263 Transcript_32536/m.32263 type:complete len:243 (+) Transcript_32536:94-822(+)